KVPRFAFEKFAGADRTLTTHMKSVGEAMSIGRSFPEALQKALRSLEKKETSFTWAGDPGDLPELLKACRSPHDGRLRTMQQAIRAGATPQQLCEATGMDPWFVDQLYAIDEVARSIGELGTLDRLDGPALIRAKRYGF